MNPCCLHFTSFFICIPLSLNKKAVNSPLHYSIIVTRQKSMAMIALVWMVAAILSAPVWAGSVLLQHYAPITSTIRTPPYSSTAHSNNKDSVFDNSALMNNETLYGASDGEQFNINSSRDQQNQQQYLMNLCYSVSLILFGFVWPLAALCWLYLRMYEAALKNSARTRRQSLCSNTNNNANAMDGTVGAAAVAAASTVAATASSNADPCFSSYGTTTMAGSHHSTLADAITSVTTTAAALASENQASMRLLAAASAAAASASTPHRHRSNRCVKSIRLCSFYNKKKKTKQKHRPIGRFYFKRFPLGYYFLKSFTLSLRIMRGLTGVYRCIDYPRGETIDSGQHP